MALDQYYPELEPELQRIAAARLRGEHACSLSPEDLINEAIVKILGFKTVELTSRSHVLAWSAKVMRQVLVDHHRRKQSDKRAHMPVTLVTNIPDTSPIELLELNSLLDQLAQADPERASLVEMRYFGGMTIPEISEVLGLSEATIKRRWEATRAFLQQRLLVP